MRRIQPKPWLSALVLLVVCTPILAGCLPARLAPTLATAQTPLPQAVEALMAGMPGPSPKLFLTTRFYDRQGVLLGEYYDEGKRYWVPLPKIAPAVRQATVATEDKTFYTNPGVDGTAIARALLQNTGEGDVISGASTITQQLARNIAMPYEKRVEQSLDRKFNETVLAQDLNQRFSKDQILEMYLNVVFYGHMAYGIEAAARAYFAKPASDLTLAESALLAALPQSPAALDPYFPENRDRAKRRQGLVLAAMTRNGYITPQEADAAFLQPLQYRSEQVQVLAPHFLQYAHDYMVAQYGKDFVDRGGLNVITTMDLRLQNKAEQIIQKQVAAVRKQYNLSNAALVAMRPGTGEVLAMVGSANFADNSINGQVNVARSLRQPGSAIKPILYSLAFSRGLAPADLIWDSPVSYRLKDGRFYSPTNYDGSYHGAVRLRQALANSYNVPAVKLLNQMGVPDMVKMAQAFGITSLTNPIETYGLALTLGGSEVSLLELAGVYSTLANGGLRVPPTPILRLTDATGREVKRLGSAPTQVVDPRVAYMISSILSDNEARTPMFGPNSPLHLSRPVAAKTGTTTDWRDNWTMGYTPYLVTGVWAGNSSGQPMRNTTGLTGAAPIWHDFMEAVFADPALERVARNPNQPLDFVRPDGLLDLPLCDVTALRGNSAACTSARKDLYIDPARPVTLVPAKVVLTTPTPAAITTTVTLTSTVDPLVTLVQGVVYAPGQVCLTGAGGQPISVVRLPADPALRNSAEAYAKKARLPVETGPCTPEMLGGATIPASAPVAQESNRAAPANAPIANNALIIDPVPGSLVTGPTDIIGSALFSKNDVQFYKVEYGSGANPGQWITMGSGHPDPVDGGRLETWYADALPNGTYAVRLVLVKRDGNYTATPPVSVYVRH
jgi:1A family penicillin-binding protein